VARHDGQSHHLGVHEPVQVKLAAQDPRERIGRTIPTSSSL
jgi:hypothetical protein